MENRLAEMRDRLTQLKKNNAPKEAVAELERMISEYDSLNNLSVIMHEVQAHYGKISKIDPATLTSLQKLWLLAYAKCSINLEPESEGGMTETLTNLCTLHDTISGTSA